MRFLPKYKLLRGADDKALAAAMLFVFFALVSTLAQAEVKSIEGLEFSRVQLKGSNELEITQGATTDLRIRGDEDELEPLPFILQGETLHLGVTRKGDSVSGVKYKLTTAKLEALELSGSGEIYVKPLAVGDLVLTIEGSGSIRLFDIQALGLEMRVYGSGELQAVDVMARDTRLNLKGSGAILLGSLRSDVLKAHMAGSGDIIVDDGGQADFAEVRVLGSGDVSLQELTAREADVAIMGSGDVHLRVEEALEVEIMGSGDLVYYGSPATSTSIVGSGEISQRD